MRKKDQELAKVRRAWRQASSELNKVLAQSQGFYHVTDTDLIQKATQLRYNIRNFRRSAMWGGGAIDSVVLGLSLGQNFFILVVARELVFAKTSELSKHTTVRHYMCLIKYFTREIYFI